MRIHTSRRSGGRTSAVKRHASYSHLIFCSGVSAAGAPATNRLLDPAKRIHVGGILRPPGTALHPDENVDARHLQLEIPHRQPVCASLDLVEGNRRRDDEVDLPQRLGRIDERQRDQVSLRDPPTHHVWPGQVVVGHGEPALETQLAQDPGRGHQGSPVGGNDHVEAGGEPRYALQVHRHAPHDHVVDASTGKGRQDVVVEELHHGVRIVKGHGLLHHFRVDLVAVRSGQVAPVPPVADACDMNAAFHQVKRALQCVS
jgi:hypothetical protein